MKLKFVGAAAIVAALIGATFTSAVAAPPVGSPSADAKSDYIVVFKDNANVGNEISALKSANVPVLDQYSNVLQGALVSMTAGQKAAFERRPNVQSVSLDTPVQSSATATLRKQDVTSVWGLDRIDQASLPLDSSFSYTADGSNVKAYILDTGIYAAHTEFTGRIGAGFSAIQGGKTADCNGHGTHVSSTVGGTNYGVAKKVTIVPVRVLDCSGSGTSSTVVKGLDWIRSQYKAGAKAVANMSLGGSANSAIDLAVTNLTNAGVTVVVAAGNSNVDACTSSPARVPSAITVAASDSSDNLASFSNYGSCVDIVAPGVNIKGAWLGSTTATNVISGTSMATPHVTGTIAAALSAGKTAADVLANATTGKVQGTLNNTPNKLLFFNY